MTYYKVTLRCENGHVQVIKLDAKMGIVWANNYAAMLDGTHALYVHSPRKDPNSLVCRCQHPNCGTLFSSEVTGPYEEPS